MADVLVDTADKSATELIAQGIKAYVLQNFNAAVTALSKASELLVLQHGDDLHESLGDVYLYYGKALLGLSREENEALGDAVPRNEEDSDDDDEEQAENGVENGGGDIKDEDDEKVETGEQEETDEKAGEATNGVESSKNEAAKDEAMDKTTEDEAAKDEASGSAVEKPEEKVENEEEPTDLQVAWEVLELAKKIFQKLGDKGRKNLAETLTVLGEVSLESENFESAINDIKEGLEIQKQLLGPDSRTIAETFYKLGIAYSTNSEIEEAIQSFQSSLDSLRNRIKYLEKLEEKKDEAEEEMKEIQSLVPDIEEKIADMKSYKEEALKKIVSAVTEGKSSDGASTSSAVTTKPVTNISHLVKRKRKADEITDENDISEANLAKKVNK